MDYSQEVAERVRRAFEAARDEDAAGPMAAYMRNRFPFLGIKSPRRAELQREALAELPRPSQEDVQTAALALWELPEREYQYTACEILDRNAKVLDAGFLPVARRLIETKSWWDTVDTLASRVVGAIILRHPEAQPEMDRWVRDTDTWVARTAILHQLRFKGATDAPRLFSYCELRAGDTEFFIRKAIGWALREFSKTDPGAVRGFVAAHEAGLSGLSKREALLWLNGGRKGVKSGASGG